ncbi:MAG: DUF169 domain-containing protein [Candidatus Helarchaeota archaeon]
MDSSKIKINYDLCIGCKKCVEICPSNVYQMEENRPKISNIDVCTLCGVCADQCPKNAIELRGQADYQKYRTDYQVRAELIEYANSLRTLLDLKKSPVAIKLLKDEKDIPKGMKPMEIPLKHCVSINTAAYGATFYLLCDKHACSAAKAALGMAELPEKVRNGKIPYMYGLAASQEAAARIMDEIPKLPLNSTIGTLVAPLENAPFDPDVVILSINPKQAMWVANSRLFETGSQD